MYDDDGKQYLDTAAGLWCASLCYASERVAKVAYEQMRKLGYYHLYCGTTHEAGSIWRKSCWLSRRCL